MLTNNLSSFPLIEGLKAQLNILVKFLCYKKKNSVDNPICTLLILINFSAIPVFSQKQNYESLSVIGNLIFYLGT